MEESIGPKLPNYLLTGPWATLVYSSPGQRPHTTVKTNTSAEPKLSRCNRGILLLPVQGNGFEAGNCQVGSGGLGERKCCRPANGEERVPC
jgi:hypothetical protein